MKKHYVFSLALLLCLQLVGRAQSLTTYQAEAGQTYAASVGTFWQGYTGSGFVGDLTQQGSSALTFTVSVPTAGDYELRHRRQRLNKRGGAYCTHQPPLR